MRNVHQNSIAGLTRRLVAHLLVFKERWLPELPAGEVRRRTKYRLAFILSQQVYLYFLVWTKKSPLMAGKEGSQESVF